MKRTKFKNQIIPTALSLSKGVLVAMYSFGSAFSRKPIGSYERDIEDFMDLLERADKKQLSRSFRYLKSKNLISIQNEYGKKSYKLTKVGFLKARKLASSFLIKRPEKWDKKWRMVIFDIPVAKRFSADSLRKDLRTLGFANLQKSIWVYPFECKDQIYLLAKKYDIQASIRYIVADYITGQGDLKELFNV